MKRLAPHRIAFTSALCLLLQGCVLSLNPLFTPETVTFQEELLGAWSDKSTSWQFSKADENKYLLTLTEKKDKVGNFDAVLVKIDDKLFLDLQPTNLPSESSPFWQFHLVRAHTFLHVQEIGPKLRMRAMNPSWLKTYLEAHPGAIQASLVDDRPILTAPSKELQQFVAKLAGMQTGQGEDGPFGQLSELTKQD